MRAVVKQTMRVFHGHVPVDLVEGQEVSGSLAAMLLKRAPGRVQPLDQPQQGTAPEPPAGLDIAATANEVLAWVGEDPSRAAEALAAEQARDKPRSTLLKALEKLAGAGDEDPRENPGDE